MGHDSTSGWSTGTAWWSRPVSNRGGDDCRCWNRRWSLDAWLETASGRATGGLLLDPLAERALTALPAPESGLTLLIGPEGGLDPRELEAARCQGFQGVRLGPRILRTETAPLAAIAVIQALWGDFRDA
jgi:16S rRNA (uracil1498-N3)-methyltransferase